MRHPRCVADRHDVTVNSTAHTVTCDLFHFARKHEFDVDQPSSSHQ
jgi:hypothetical protein